MANIRKLLKFHGSVSFQIILLLVVLLLPLNIISIRASAQYASALEEQARQNIGSITSLYMNDISAKARYATTYISQQLVSNPSFITLQKQTGDSEYILARNILSREFVDTSQREYAGDVFFFYSPKLDEVMVSRREVFEADRGSIAEYVRENAEEAYGRNWKLAQVDGQQYIIRSFWTYDMYFGVLIGLDEPLLDMAESIGYDNVSVDLLAEPSFGANPAELIVAEQAEGLDFTMRVSVPWTEIQRGLTTFQRIQKSFTLVYLVLIPLLIILLRRMLVKPLQAVSAALVRFREGESGHRLPQKASATEFATIQQSFNDMADNIVELKIDNYEHQMARKEIELQNLQLTIRPHFLQNTFGLLYTLSQTGEMDKTGEFVLYLSNYFRSIHQGMEYLVPFSQELSLIQSYLDIAMQQYPGNIAAAYDVGEEALNTHVPSLLLHNFIENAVSHGLIKGKLLTIQIKAYSMGHGKTRFQIEDDGLGMEETIRRQINAGEVVDIDGRVHVGLYNSFHRLQMIYGDSARLHVESSIGSGTSITVEVPGEGPKEAQ